MFALWERHPDVELSVRFGDFVDPSAGLRDGDADVASVAGPFEESDWSSSRCSANHSGQYWPATIRSCSESAAGSATIGLRGSGSSPRHARRSPRPHPFRSD
jgi:DNA-binding transcriptional LysR family regulator